MRLAGYRQIDHAFWVGREAEKPGYDGCHAPHFCPLLVYCERQRKLKEVCNHPTGDLMVMHIGTFRA